MSAAVICDECGMLVKNPAHYIAVMQSLRQMAKYTGQTSAQTACHCSLKSSTF